MTSTFTKVDRSFHREVLATDTTREHHVSLDTYGPSGSSQQPRVVLTEVASSGTSNRFAPRQGPFSGMMETLQTRLLSTESLGSPNFLLSINAKLGSDDHVKVENHLQTLRSHKPITVLDVLFRHNLLFSRAKLYQLFLDLPPVIHNPTSEVGAEPASESTNFRRIDDIRQALGDYSSAMEAYRTFRKEPGEINSDDYIMALAGMLTELEKKRSQLKAAQEFNSKTADDEAIHRVTSEAEISTFEAQIAHVLVSGARFSPAGVRTEEKSKARLSFLGRLAMAIFGGAALVVPMLIMSLRPSKLTGLLTTSLFVVGVAVALAWFMKDAAPKDILAATAAYAAVLVVFVGTDGA
ncbi:hypothetical protein B0J15DRAFT_540752 [Fusarium solani]|uniref:DUF6594 domain-containing protein n=1 Tax=Fusarium solani TaxID=169388 RepID=A0A9P9RE80_FUSSL|nr:uncharacterized protein B0J15DRAFT_540752 [Fusarium solani]KAH7275752.1 hypothetical protein B0J15DRAFT_540752 [Fusarium solani]